MNINNESVAVSKCCRYFFPLFCLLVFLPIQAVFAQVTLRTNGKIAFTSNRDGNLEIYVMNHDGTSQTRLTNNPGVDDHPAFSPDGSRIAFISQNASGAFSIKLMNADGTNQTTLAPIAYENSQYPWHGKFSLNWSPDGSKLAFQERGDIFTINVDGSNRINLTSNPAQDIEPSWSADGSRIIFTSSRVFWMTLHTMKADGSDVRALPSEGEFWDMSPVWSPKGDKIAFVVHSETDLPRIYTANLDGTNRQVFDSCGSGACSSHRNKPTWSPDGTKIAFHIWEFFTNDAEIYVKNTDGSGFARLTDTSQGSNFNPSWQPVVSRISSFRNNGKIAFTSTRDGNREIYVMNPDGTEQVRLTNNPGRDDYPAWSPDGKRIAYLSQSGSGGFSINLMNSDGTNKTQLTSIIFNIFPNSEKFSLDWSPDGGKIAFQDNGDIFTININGNNRFRLTNGGAPNAFAEPSWSPDSSHIAYSCGGIICVIKADGTEGKVLNINLPGNVPYEHSPDWSAVDDQILFARSIELDSSYLGAVKADGTNARILDFSPSYDFAKARWSPDGTKIVFSHPSRQIFVMNADTSSPRQLTSTGTNFNPAWQPLVSARTFADFDGDGKADLSVFRPSDKSWYLNQSAAGFSAIQFGLSTDKITPADFDGDGKTDIAVFREGTWYWLSSSTGGFNAFQFGSSGDIPVPADFTGDARAELAVYRGGNWFVLNLSNNQFSSIQFGISSDKPVANDYDGDGRTDFAVYREGTWYLLQSTQGFAAIQFGLPTDRLVPADYDGDGKADLGVYRGGTWYLLRSNQGFTAFQFGAATDTPAPADYDGDGQTDAAVYRNGVWYLHQSRSGFSAQQFGLTGDMPIPTAFLY